MKLCYCDTDTHCQILRRWNQNIPWELGQYHDCWWLGSLCRYVIISHCIGYARQTIVFNEEGFQLRVSHRPSAMPFRNRLLIWIQYNAHLHPSATYDIYASLNWVIVGLDKGLSPVVKWTFSNKFKWNFNKKQHFHSKILIWKCRLRNGGQTVSVLMC